MLALVARRCFGGCSQPRGRRHPAVLPEGDEEALKSLESGTSGCLRFIILPVVPVGSNGQALLHVRMETGEVLHVEEIQCLRWHLGLLIVSTMRQQKLHTQKPVRKAWARACHFFDDKSHVAQNRNLAIVARGEIERQL